MKVNKFFNPALAWVGERKDIFNSPVKTLKSMLEPTEHD